MRFVQLLAGTFLFASTCAHAYMSVSMYQLGDRSTTGLYVAGVVNGFSFANSSLKEQGLPPLFCMVENLPMNGDNYLAMIDDEIQRLKEAAAERGLNFDHATETNLLIELILLKRLQRVFPCAE